MDVQGLETSLQAKQGLEGLMDQVLELQGQLREKQELLEKEQQGRYCSSAPQR